METSGNLFFDNAIYQVYNYAVKSAAFHETAAPGGSVTLKPALTRGLSEYGGIIYGTVYSRKL